jgi:eukaryotic-like serine/threonine-protein kinase
MMAPDPQHSSLGAFSVKQLLGAGGMGEVWLGEHQPSGRPIVVKTIARRFIEDPRFVHAFRGEVEAVARLDHPAIVTIHDYGQTSSPSVLPGGAVLDVGTPYMVMDWVPGKPLHHAALDLSWPQLRTILAQLLDALAYAHARGVIHRDLKPPNIMFDELTQRARLIDFGIASIRSTNAQQRRFDGGTPAYMAPEQLLAHSAWAEGPWTDLYALGCTAWELVVGHPPLVIRTAEDAVHAHLIAAREPLYDPPNVPTGFARWVERLIASEPADRFQRAADALWALRALPEHAPAISLSPPDPHVHTWETALNTLGCLDAFDAPSLGMSNEPQHRQELELPPTPPTWRDPEGHRRDITHLTGAGLGLYGLRAPEIMGREAERDLLWSTLTSLDADPAPRIYTLDGPAGVGKSSLALWLCQRAHELGAATPLVAVHDRSGSPGDGIGPMLLREYGGADVPPDQLPHRIKHRLATQGVVDPAEVSLLLDALSPRDAEHHRADTPPQLRHGAIARAIARLAQQRPVILWIDDLQWGADALAFLQFFIPWARAARPRLLILITTRDMEPGEDADWLAQHSELLPIGPLASAEHRALVERLLGLTGALAESVAQRTEGNPLFATQLIGDWVTRGILIPGQRGFMLEPGAAVPVPDSIGELLTERLDGALALAPDGASESGRDALELAAALGRRVQQDEWERLCAMSGHDAPTWLLDAMAHRGLARREPDGWQFAHGMLNESIELRMRRDGRWAHASLLAARMLQQRTPPTNDLLNRACAHIIEAEQIDEALDLLGDVASHSTPERSAALIARTQHLIMTLPSAERTELRLARLTFLRGLRDVGSGALPTAAAELKEAERRFAQLGATARLLFTRVKLGWLLFYEGQLGPALDLAMEVLPHSAQLAAELERINLDRLIGNIHCFARRPHLALPVLMQAIERADALPSHWDAAWARYEAAMTCMDLGLDHYDEAHRLLAAALERMEAQGERIGVASCYLLRGSLQTHNLELALDAPGWELGLADFQRAYDMLEAFEEPGRFIACENLGRAALALARYDLARHHLERVAAASKESSSGIFAGFVHDALVVVALATQDHDRLELAMREAEAWDQERQPAEPFCARTFDYAARLALKQGHDALAKRLAALAQRAWDQIHEDEPLAEESIL